MLVKDIVLSKKNLRKTAVKCGNEEITYEELYYRSVFGAQYIRSFDDVGENIAIFIPNSIHYIVAYFAVAFLDKTIVPVHIQTKSYELKSLIEYCDLRVIITDSKWMGKVQSYIEESGYSVHVVNICDIHCTGKETLEVPKATNINQNDENRIALMLHTSGTTSSPKRVMLSHRNLIANVVSIIESLKLNENDRTLIAMPMCMASANTSQLLTHLYLGAEIIIMDSIFLPTAFSKTIKSHKVTNFTGVPSYMKAITKYACAEHFDISSLRLICFGGAKSRPEDIMELYKALPGVAFVHMYGQTEAATRICHLLPEDAHIKLGSVGKPIPGILIRIIDECGTDMSAGQCGEIIVKGENVMAGYYKRPEETGKSLKDGWLYTGDLGRFDEEGYLYITGRKRNVIISGGMNIYPEDVEEVLLGHEYIEEACVSGEDDELYGQAPVARVVLKDGKKPIDEAELINYCAEYLSNYKLPRKIYFVSELQKTPNGKIIRNFN